MVTISTVFWVLVAFFAVIGAMRGWAKEIVAAAGIILALFAISQLGPALQSFFPPSTTPAQRFGIKTGIFLAIAYFSYQGPGLAAAATKGKFAAKMRAGIQDTLLGLGVGVLNGCLIVGTVWFFLKYEGYPFPALFLQPQDGWESIMMAQKYLPPVFLAPWLPYLLIAFFLFVIVAVI